jgi:SAM-dependent methyltransferase
MGNEYRDVNVRKHDRKHPRKPNTTIPVRKHQRRICVCDPQALARSSIMAGKPPTESREKSLVKKDGQYDLLRYLPSYWQSDPSSYYRFENLPASDARKMMTGQPNIDPEDNQNRSPASNEMIQLATKHHGTLEGYVIPVTTGRVDSRISIDSFTIKASREDAMKLRDDLRNTKHSFVEDGEYISWNEGPDEFEENTFDYVVASEVLEHVSNFYFVVEQIHRVLKPGGRFIITVPNHSKFYWSIRAIRAKHYREIYLKGNAGSKGHIHAFDELCLRNLLRFIGFKLVFCDRFYNRSYHHKLPEARIFNPFALHIIFIGEK